MKKLWKYRFYILTISGATLMFTNCTDTWDNNLKFILFLVGMLIAFIAVCLQLIISSDFDTKCPDCGADINYQNGKCTFKKHN